MTERKECRTAIMASMAMIESKTEQMKVLLILIFLSSPLLCLARPFLPSILASPDTTSVKRAWWQLTAVNEIDIN